MRYCGESYTLGGLANPVQPDLLFVSRERLDVVTERLIDLAPDLIAEVISPGSGHYGRYTKFYLYAEARVREYWLVDPEAKTIEVNVLRGTAYALLAVFGLGEQIRSEILPDFQVAVDVILQS
jgi:Uma2 family endonuclease